MKVTVLDDWPVEAGMRTNRLLEYVGPYAQDMIRKDGFLWPCGVGISADGKLEPFAVAPDGFANVDEAFQFMVAQLIADRNHWAAVCCAVAVTLPDGSDALNFIIEHASGHAAAALMRFRRTRLLRNVVFDQLSLTPVEPVVWAWDPDLE